MPPENDNPTDDCPRKKMDYTKKQQKTQNTKPQNS